MEDLSSFPLLKPSQILLHVNRRLLLPSSVLFFSNVFFSPFLISRYIASNLRGFIVRNICIYVYRYDYGFEKKIISSNLALSHHDRNTIHDHTWMNDVARTRKKTSRKKKKRAPQKKKKKKKKKKS